MKRNITILSILIIGIIGVILFVPREEPIRTEIIQRCDNGQKEIVVTYQGYGADEKIVERITYSCINGIEKYVEKFKDGKKHGQWNVLDDYGKIIATQSYINGLMHGQNCYSITNLPSTSTECVIYDNGTHMKMDYLCYKCNHKRLMGKANLNQTTIDPKVQQLVDSYRETHPELLKYTDEELYGQLSVKYEDFPPNPYRYTYENQTPFFMCAKCDAKNYIRQ